MTTCEAKLRDRTYDLEKGRLIFRHKDERPGTGAPRGAPPRGQFRRR